MSKSHPIAKKYINMVQRCLEREFPKQVRDTRWDEYSGVQALEIVHENTMLIHYVSARTAFFGPVCTAVVFWR